MPIYEKVEDGYVQTYDCGHPLGRSPKILNLNLPNSCATSASNYHQPTESFVTIVQKPKKLEASQCQVKVEVRTGNYETSGF